MVSTNILLLGASLLVLAQAQKALEFTSVPTVVVAGESYNITWGGGDGSPVKITLEEGNSTDLKSIGTLADVVKDDFFLWDVSKSLDTASDYTLQITQGQNDTVKSSVFSVNGEDTSSNATASVTSLSSTGTAPLSTGPALPRNMTFTSASVSSTATLPPAVTVHESASITSDGTSGSSTPTAVATTTAPSGGAVQLGSSAALVMGVFAAVLCLG